MLPFWPPCLQITIVLVHSSFCQYKYQHIKKPMFFNFSNFSIGKNDYSLIYIECTLLILLPFL